jgi:7,8-dihydroneopterin aldolase/epimerase/oxygenase
MSQGPISPMPTVLSLAVDQLPRRVERLRVFMRDLTVDAEIGLYARERGRRQPLRISVDAEIEPQRITEPDQTVNYEHFATKARALCEDGHIDLVETFAERYADLLLDHPRVIRVTVRVEKPEALGDMADVGVEVTLAKA